MKKIFYVNKKNNEKFELIGKKGQIYTLKNEHDEIIEKYRIQLNKNKFDVIEIDENIKTIGDENFERFKNEFFNNNIKLLCEPKKRKNKKHQYFKIIDSENEIHEFKTVNEFANYLMTKFNKTNINKGHLYNLINGKTKSYLQHKLYIE